MEEPVITLGVSQYNKLVDMAKRNLDRDREVWNIILNHLEVSSRTRDFIINRVLAKYYREDESPSVKEIEKLWCKK